MESRRCEFFPGRCVQRQHEIYSFYRGCRLSNSTVISRVLLLIVPMFVFGGSQISAATLPALPTQARWDHGTSCRLLISGLGMQSVNSAHPELWFGWDWWHTTPCVRFCYSRNVQNIGKGRARTFWNHDGVLPPTMCCFLFSLPTASIIFRSRHYYTTADF